MSMIGTDKRKQSKAERKRRLILRQSQRWRTERKKSEGPKVQPISKTLNLNYPKRRK